MDLPKNITQIGVPDKKIKIYVEDYVVSYMKQFNLVAADKEMAIAMYGNRKKENDLVYLFIYGAIKLDLIQKETKNLSKTQMEEVQHSGQLHFPEYTFQAYCLLNGEMVEGMYVCEENRANYVSGYARFYEKNDKMLALLIESRGEKIKPEIVDLDKYEMVRKRQEGRKISSNEKKKTNGQGGGRVDGQADGQTDGQVEATNKGIKSHSAKMRMAAGFAIVALLGGFAYNHLDSQIDWRGMMKQVMENFGEQKLPDLVAASSDNPDSVTIKDEMNEMISETDQRSAEADTGIGEINQTILEIAQGVAEADQGGGEVGLATSELEMVTADSDQVSSEVNKVTAGSDQVSSELNKVTADSDQVSSEANKVTVESDQVSSEANRVTVDSDQVTSETAQVIGEVEPVTSEMVQN